MTTISKGGRSAADAKFERELVELHPFLLAYSRRLTGSLEAAEDLVQDVMIKALHYRKSYQEGTNLKAWLFTILKNQHFSDRRRNWRMVLLGDDMPDFMGPDDPGARQDLLDILEVMAKSLNHQQLNVLILATRGDSMEEIAAKLDITEGTVKSQLARARDILRLFS